MSASLDSRPPKKNQEAPFTPPPDDHKEVKRALIGSVLVIAGALIGVVCLVILVAIPAVQALTRTTADRPTPVAVVSPAVATVKVTHTPTATIEVVFTKTPAPTLSPSATASPTATETPAPTPTSVFDFGSGCIPYTLWEPLEETALTKHRAGGCWVYEVKANFAAVPDVGLNVMGTVPRGGIRSFYTPLPSHSQVRFKVRVDKLNSLNLKNYIYLFFGVGPKYDFYINGQYVLFGSALEEGLSLFQSDSYFTPGDSLQSLQKGTWQEVRFVLDRSKVSIEVGDLRQEHTLPAKTAGQPYFFIAVGAPGAGVIDAVIKDFEITELK